MKVNEYYRASSLEDAYQKLQKITEERNSWWWFMDEKDGPKL